jgi:hypothetical protein
MGVVASYSTYSTYTVSQDFVPPPRKNRAHIVDGSRSMGGFPRNPSIHCINWVCMFLQLSQKVSS